MVSYRSPKTVLEVRLCDASLPRSVPYAPFQFESISKVAGDPLFMGFVDFARCCSKLLEHFIKTERSYNRRDLGKFGFEGVVSGIEDGVGEDRRAEPFLTHSGDMVSYRSPKTVLEVRQCDASLPRSVLCLHVNSNI